MFLIAIMFINVLRDNYFMKLFMPSKKILETICVKGEKPLTFYGIYPFGSCEEMMNVCYINEVGIYAKILEFYSKDETIINERLYYEGVNNVLGEAFKNWVDHGQEGLNLMMGLFLGNLGICYGLCDGGDFFKNPEIKNQLENKIPFKVFDDSARGDTRNKGFNLNIFPYSDLIEVDAKKGVLYCVQLKENFIAPLGENGSSYFYHKRLKEQSEKPI